jgi:quercetin dioxygenase-like cupin family protein
MTGRNWMGVGMIVVAASAAAAYAGTTTQRRASESRRLFSGPLPAMDGRRLEATIVEVTFAPAGANPAHRHPCPVIGYVLEGRLRMQVEGQPTREYGPGETFYESPSDLHVVSANAGRDDRARFLAYFVCDHETPLSVPVASAGTAP